MLNDTEWPFNPQTYRNLAQPRRQKIIFFKVYLTGYLFYTREIKEKHNYMTHDEYERERTDIGHNNLPT